ncbi:MAG: hypothetical protein P1U63_10435 [Coxiellaceae bacterium]|nr:hypothetical protein [Coxiellaceae bacterium]
MRRASESRLPGEGLNLFLDLSVIIDVEEISKKKQRWRSSPCASFFNAKLDKTNWLSVEVIKRSNVFFMLPAEHFYFSKASSQRLLFLLDWLYNWRSKGALKQANGYLLFYNHKPDLGQPLWRAHAKIDSDGRLAPYDYGPRGKLSPTCDELATFVVTEKQYMLDYFHPGHVSHTRFPDGNKMIDSEIFTEKFRQVQSKVMGEFPLIKPKPAVKKSFLRRRLPRSVLPRVTRKVAQVAMEADRVKLYDMPSMDSIRRGLLAEPVIGRPPLRPKKPAKPKIAPQRLFGCRRLKPAAAVAAENNLRVSL